MVKKAGKSGRKVAEQPISFAPLDFETAVRAAMQTGKPPKVKAKKKRRRAPRTDG